MKRCCFGGDCFECCGCECYWLGITFSLDVVAMIRVFMG